MTSDFDVKTNSEKDIPLGGLWIFLTENQPLECESHGESFQYYLVHLYILWMIMINTLRFRSGPIRLLPKIQRQVHIFLVLLLRFPCRKTCFNKLFHFEPKWSVCMCVIHGTFRIVNRIRYSTCFRDEYYCCEHFTLSGHTCLGTLSKSKLIPYIFSSIYFQKGLQSSFSVLTWIWKLVKLAKCNSVH